MTKSETPVAWVTGSTRGIGKSCAKWFAINGYSVVVHGRDEGQAEQVAEEFRRSYGRDVLVVAGDISDASWPSEAVKQIHSKFGRLDVLVANAGLHHASPISMVQNATVDLIIDTNVKGTYLTVQHASRLMRRSPRSSVVVIGSVMGDNGVSGQVLYSMSKAAVRGLVVASSRELASQNTRVNGVLPGYVSTDMSAGLSDEMKAEIISGISLRRFADSDEIAEVVGFLTSEKSDYITGQLLTIDGGIFK